MRVIQVRGSWKDYVDIHTLVSGLQVINLHNIKGIGGINHPAMLAGL